MRIFPAIISPFRRGLQTLSERRRTRHRAALSQGAVRDYSPGRAERGQRGIAIIAVSVAVVFLTTISFEFSTNTNVDYVAAGNARDNIRAHFLARSAMNLTHLMIRFQTDILDKNRKRLGDIQFADFAPMFMGLFGGSKGEVEGYSALLGAPGGDKLKGLGISAGEFTVHISTEDAKINVNCAHGNEQTRQTLKAKLEALIYFDAFNPVFENPDAEGWQRTRAEQVTAILDYIDRDGGKFGAGGSPEDYGYETLDDKYRAKNNYLDSVEEIKLIRGVDDQFWTLFGNQFTVYGGCTVNLAAVTDIKLLASIIYLSAKADNDPVVRDPEKLWALASVVAQAKNFGMSWDELKTFADFVRDPAGQLETLFNIPDNGNVPLPSLSQVDGVELDLKKLGQVAHVGSRRTYRVEATAFVGAKNRRFVKRMTGVWDTQTTNQNSRDPSYAKGAWVFWKED